MAACICICAEPTYSYLFEDELLQERQAERVAQVADPRHRERAARHEKGREGKAGARKREANKRSVSERMHITCARPLGRRVPLARSLAWRESGTKQQC